MSQHKSSPMCKNMPLSPNSLRAVLWIGGLDLGKRSFPRQELGGHPLTKSIRLSARLPPSCGRPASSGLRSPPSAWASNGASMAWAWIGLAETGFLFLGDPQSLLVVEFPGGFPPQKPPNMRCPPKNKTQTQPASPSFTSVSASVHRRGAQTCLVGSISLCWEALNWLVPAAWF